jgi:hypothetical protein
MDTRLRGYDKDEKTTLRKTERDHPFFIAKALS